MIDDIEHTTDPENSALASPDLKGFADDMLEVFFEGCSIDGFDIQELAEKHKLLTKTTVLERCGDNCACAEYDSWPADCYRKAY